MMSATNCALPPEQRTLDASSDAYEKLFGCYQSLRSQFIVAAMAIHWPCIRHSLSCDFDIPLGTARSSGSERSKRQTDSDIRKQVSRGTFYSTSALVEDFIEQILQHMTIIQCELGTMLLSIPATVWTSCILPPESSLCTFFTLRILLEAFFRKYWHV